MKSGLATMVRTPDEGRCMNGIGFIRDFPIGIEVPDLISFLRFCGVIFKLNLFMLIEDVHRFVADLGFVPFLFSLRRFPLNSLVNSSSEFRVC